MSGEVRRGPAYDDDRGRLVPVEFADLELAPARAFVVVATDGPSRRGGHRADSRELLVLVAGSATVVLTSSDGSRREHLLAEPGDRLSIDADEHVDYNLESQGTTMLVLADQPYDPDLRRRRG